MATEQIIVMIENLGISSPSELLVIGVVIGVGLLFVTATITKTNHQEEDQRDE